MQDASLTYQQFKNCRDNLSSWLEHLPHSQVRPSDGPSQIAYKLQAQKVSSWGCRRPEGRSGPCPSPPAHVASSHRESSLRMCGPLVASVLRDLKADHRGLGSPPPPTPERLHCAHRNSQPEVSSGLYAPRGSDSRCILFLVLAKPLLCTGNEPRAGGAAWTRAARAGGRPVHRRP